MFCPWPYHIWAYTSITILHVFEFYHEAPSPDILFKIASKYLFQICVLFMYGLGMTVLVYYLHITALRYFNVKVQGGPKVVTQTFRLIVALSFAQWI